MLKIPWWWRLFSWVYSPRCDDKQHSHLLLQSVTIKTEFYLRGMFSTILTKDSMISFSVIFYGSYPFQHSTISTASIRIPTFLASNWHTFYLKNSPCWECKNEISWLFPYGFFSNIYIHTHFPRPTFHHRNFVSMALDVYRVSRVPMALQELLFPQRVSHAEIPDVTRGCAQSSLCSIAQKVWSIPSRLDSKHICYQLQESGAGASFQLLASILQKEGVDFA